MQLDVLYCSWGTSGVFFGPRRRAPAALPSCRIIIESASTGSKHQAQVSFCILHMSALENCSCLVYLQDAMAQQQMAQQQMMQGYGMMPGYAMMPDQMQVCALHSCGIASSCLGAVLFQRLVCLLMYQIVEHGWYRKVPLTAIPWLSVYWLKLLLAYSRGVNDPVKHPSSNLCRLLCADARIRPGPCAASCYHGSSTWPCSSGA